ncbi:MAG: hypothetical protein JST45_03785 [Bacteroidetes bacterium]|nr:hypothetical protein [Bacteroidota bacterium]
MRGEKLFRPIGLAFFPVLQVLATASIVFVSYAGGVMKFVWPDARGWVAFIVVVAGALFQVGKLIHESSDKKKQEQQALELKRSEDQFAIYHLEGVCHTVNSMLNWMAVEAKVEYPCRQENDFPNWHLVHNMYRTNLINFWAERKAYWLDRLKSEHKTEQERQDLVLGILDSWRRSLYQDVRALNLGNRIVMPLAEHIRTIIQTLDSNWGMNDLVPMDRQNAKTVMRRIGRSIQDIINVSEFIYPSLKRDEYASGRQRCAEIQNQCYPNQHYTDLIFATRNGLPHQPGTPFP